MKINSLKTELRERGLFYALKRAAAYLFRPLDELIQQSLFLTELTYGFLPKAFMPFLGPGSIRFSETDLMRDFRKFWYCNVPGFFNLEEENIGRKEIFVYGGPNPEFSCFYCQKSEWLSRLRQKNLFIEHSCHTSQKCKTLCSRQGDELWTHLHQNFNFSIGYDATLPSPKILYIDPNAKENFFSEHCDVWQLVTQRRLAMAGQVELVRRPAKIKWRKYDCVFIVNNGKNIKFGKPGIPVIVYGHDFWPTDKKGFQWVIDWAKPDVFMSSCLGCWQDYYRFPDNTEFVFYPFFDSLFFSRPNLAEKQYDLLVVGAMTSQIYKPRNTLVKQVRKLAENGKNRYRIEFSRIAGSGNVFREGGVIKEDSEAGSPIFLLNKWSEYLSRAKYVIFGRMEYPFATGKHYEVLGSGAVPIFPEVPDLKFLGVKPFEHYIPLSEVEGNNEKLAHILGNYRDYCHIAENAVNWYKENSDRLIFNDFEDVINRITGNKYPKRCY